jgi:hypothetical protein
MQKPAATHGVTAGLLLGLVPKDQKPKLIEPMIVRGGLIWA